MSSVSSCDSSVLTWKPSMAAWSAQMGSHSVTVVTQPAAFMAKAQPLPTSPWPQMTTRLPASMTSVARQMPSGSECLQPYRLSNLDLVTESFTLMAGKSSSPFFSITYRRCTPVVVSSDTPNMRFAILFHLSGCFARPRLMIVSTILNSALVVDSGSGSVPSFANRSSAFLPSCTSSVMSPPSSTMRSGPSPCASAGNVIALSVHSQYSSSVSPFHAKTAVLPAAAIAEAAWYCVEKMLHEHRRLDRHVERARDARAHERLGAVLLARHHET